MWKETRACHFYKIFHQPNSVLQDMLTGLILKMTPQKNPCSSSVFTSTYRKKTTSCLCLLTSSFNLVFPYQTHLFLLNLEAYFLRSHVLEDFDFITPPQKFETIADWNEKTLNSCKHSITIQPVITHGFDC